MTATPVSELRLPGFDYTDPTLRGERFHAVMRELGWGARGWLASGPYGYIVLDREAGEWWLRTRDAIFPGMTIAQLFGVEEGPLYEQMRRNILHVNGPDHTRLRSLVNPALSARAVERYRPALRELLEGLWAKACAGGAERDGMVRCEFVGAFAKPYPSRAIARVMGAPVEDAERLHHWSMWIQRQFDAAAMATEREGIERAVEEFYEYAQALVAARRAQSRGGDGGEDGEDDGEDDLLSRLIAAEEEGERLSDVECINLVFNVLVGGVDTTQSQLAHAVRLLAEHPEQWELLRGRPELAEAAVEEALRYEPITPFTARITTREVTYRDVVFPEGTIVMVCAFTGNRDLPAEEGAARGKGGSEGGGAAPGAGMARSEDVLPDVFDIAAERGRARPLTFGAGVHYCLGANLARLELREALGFLAERVGELRVEGEVEYETIMGIYGLAKLPLAFSV